MLVKTRKFTAKHSLLATIIMTGLIEIVFWISPVNHLFPNNEDLADIVNRIIYTGLIILFIVFFMKNNLIEIGYSAKKLKEGLKTGGFISITIFVFSVISMFINISKGTGHFMSTSAELTHFFLMFFLVVSVGLFEESAYRAVPVNILRNVKGLTERQYMFYCVMISSFLFGAVHLGNMVSGYDTPAQAIARSLQAIGTGMIIAAIYWRSGSLLACIIFHIIWDSSLILNSLYIVDKSPAEGMAKTTSDIITIATGFILFCILLCISLFLLRKKKCTGCNIEAITIREQLLNDEVTG